MGRTWEVTPRLTLGVRGAEASSNHCDQGKQSDDGHQE